MAAIPSVSRFRRSAFPVPEFPRNGRPDRRMYMNSLFLIYLTQSRPEFHQSENAAVEKIPKTSTYHRKVVLNINIIHFWTSVLIFIKYIVDKKIKSSRAHFQLFSCSAIFWDLGRKEEKTTCKVTWAQDRRAGESRNLFEHAADVRDSANTEYSTLSHIEIVALNEICPVCVWV